MKKSFYTFCVLVLLALIPFPGVAADLPTHLDSRKLPYGCSSCHTGFDFRSGGGTSGCLTCHGKTSKIPPGLVAPGVDLRDMTYMLAKTYKHPVNNPRSVHSSGEELPETDSRVARHADCVDCHNVHKLRPGNLLAGVRGKRVGNLTSEVSAEYELCYKCHGDSANLPPRSTNKRLEFSLNNLSFHPVEGEGRNSAVVSLIRPYREKKSLSTDISVISCTSCHAGDGVEAPRGPHGSNFPYILSENYSIKDAEGESFYAYSLCYRCHSRTSILNDESFRFHALHIRGKGGAAWGNEGTSCYTCHSSHGSPEYKYLIRFNRDVVTPNSRGLLKFVEKSAASFHGECFLSCHGVDHNPKSY